jgi:1-phosphofructokinase
VSRVAIFSPHPLLSVNVASRAQQGEGNDDIHILPAGQGAWVARMAGELGSDPVLCGFAGGETGRILSGLLEAMPGASRLVETAGASGCYVVDRRRGETDLLAEALTQPPSQPEVDELFSITCAAALESEVLVICNPYPTDALPVDVYSKLTSDVRESGTSVLVDLSSPRLESALEGRPDLVKLNDWELGEFTREAADTPDQIRHGAEALLERGAGSVLVTRGGDPALALGEEGVWVLEAPRFDRGHREGCGDAMMGGIAAGLATGREWRDALILGAAAGAANFLRQDLGSASREVVEELREQVSLTPL